MKNNHSKTYFRQLLKAKVGAAKDKGRTYKPPRFKKPPRPLNIQREYTKQLDDMVKYLRHLYETEVFPAIPAIVDKAQAHKKDSLRRDTYADDTDHVMNKVQIQFQQKYSKPVKASLARNIGQKVNKFSQGVVEGQVKTLVGTNVFTSEPWLEEKMSAFVKENVDLITKWSDDLKSQAEGIIMRGARTGTNPDDIASELRDRIGVVESRYDFIARDQTLKFNGQLTQTRNEDLGLDRYTWDTSHDERVRPMHEALDGEVFSYDDPPVTNEEGDTNNPGEDYNCVPEDAEVLLHSPTIKAFRRWYTGELTEIITDTGKSLRATPNHPVLTNRGWIACNLVKVGDYLVEAPNKTFNPPVTNPKSRNPTAIEIFRSFKDMGLSHRIAGRASWFHGDASDKEVNIIEINRKLFLDNMAKFSESIGENKFTSTPKPGFAGSHISSNAIGLFSSTDGSMSRIGPSSPISKTRKLHPIEHSVASVSYGNVVFDQSLSYDSSTNIESFSDSLLAHSVIVKPDDFIFRKVKSVISSPWSGWVHNFETVTGWFSSSNLIIHNCRCVAIPFIDDLIGELSDEIDEEDQDEFDQEQEEGDEG